MRQRHLDDLADPVLVNVVHGEALDVVFPEDSLFGRVDVTEADVDAMSWAKAGEREVRDEV
jgi:hypothetical protein